MSRSKTPLKAVAGRACPSTDRSTLIEAQPPTDRHSPCAIDPQRVVDTMLEGAFDSVTVFDRDGVILRISRSMAEILRLSPDECIGRRLRDIAGDEVCERMDRVLAGERLMGEGSYRHDGLEDELWIRYRWLPIRDREGAIVGGLAMAADMSFEKRARQQAEDLVNLDPLTGLLNRTALAQRLSRALAGARARKRQLALAWLNLDRFKDVVEAHGTAAGDQLVRAAGERLRAAVRTSDVVARVGGDDFAVLLPRVNSRRHLVRLLDRLQGAFDEPFLVQGEAIFVTASCGVAAYPDGGSEAQELLGHAGAAMRVARELGAGGRELYEAGAFQGAGRRLRLAGEIREGVRQGQFVPFFQPQVGLETMRVQAMEALARWQHPERGLLPPSEFIGFAEEAGLAVPLGSCLFDSACRQLEGWRKDSPTPPRLAFNVSARGFLRTDLCGQVRHAGKVAGIPPSSLEFEITEMAVLANPDKAAQVASDLRAMGVTIALDDFGTGYSSLTHLCELPIDCVKIDRSFVARCVSDRSAAAIVASIARLAHDLGLRVIAEGVETEEQLDFVRAVGCDAAQGYLFAKALPSDKCRAYLRHGTTQRGTATPMG